MAKFLKVYGEHINVNKVDNFYPMEIVKESKLTKGAYIAGVIVVDDEEYELTFKPGKYDSEEEKIDELFKYIKILTYVVESFFKCKEVLVLDFEEVEASIMANLKAENNIADDTPITACAESYRGPIQASIKISVFDCGEAEKCMEEFIEFRKTHNDIDYNIEIDIKAGAHY